MDSRMAFSDSNDISSTCSLGPYAANNPSSADNVVSPDAFAPPYIAALRLLSDNLDSLFDPDPDEFDPYADSKIAVESKEVAVHRSILSVRSPYLKKKFAYFKERDAGRVRFELRDLAGDFAVGFDALVTVLAYLYSGKVKPLPRDVCACVDDECSHVGCRPVVDFMVEVLYLSFTFQIGELVSLYQRRLLEIVDRITPDDLLVVLSVASLCEGSCQRLHATCVDMVIRSDVDSVALEKALPMHIAKAIIDERKELGLIALEDDGFPDKHVRRIHRALDSDDIELVNMLLKEGHTTLDDAYALHYAVAYCDASLIKELLDLGFANVNRKDLRGFSVLHVAAKRREPNIIILLLTKGAWPTDVTGDGRNALQISKRLTKAADYHKSQEEGKPSHRDQLCIEILLQAERREPMFLGEGSLSLARAGDDLRSKLLYLENRVGLARCLFPEEAKVAMDIAQVGGTTELTSQETMDLNEAPFVIKDEYHQRIRALENTVKLGKRFFPRCSQVLDKIMDADDDLTDIMGSNTSEGRMMKKQRFIEIQEMLRSAFTEDLEAKKRSTASSSSSSTPSAKHLGRLSYKR